MKKKIIYLGIALVMLFSLAGLTACNLTDLAAYKTTAKAELTTYADARCAELSCAEASAAIQQIAADGKDAIEAAATKSDVNIARDAAKADIDAVSQSFTAELESRIKADFLQEFGYELYFGDELLNKFYGLYNGSAVFFIAGVDAAIKNATISGVSFRCNYSWTILVWKDGIFYDLEDIEVIFDVGILTQSDLEQIGVAHAEANVK